MRLLKRVFWIAILLVIVLFAVVNMDNRVAVRLDPFKLGYEALQAFELPLPFLILISLAVGLIVGVMLENDRSRGLRRDLRKEQRRRGELETELKRLQAAMKAADHPDSAGLPVLRR